MTVPVPGSLTYTYLEDGVTTVFSYPVRFLEATELVVIREAADGQRSTLVYNTDYTVSGAGNPSGGSITRTAVTDGGKIILTRSTAPKQLVDLKDAQRNPAEAVELQLDRLAMSDQEHRRDIGRSWKAEYGAEGKRIDAVPPGHFHRADDDGNLVDAGLALPLPAGGSKGQVLTRDEGPDGAAVWASNVQGGGDMLSSAYDPRKIGGDAFDSASHVYTQAGAGGLTRPTILRFRETIHATEFVDVNDTGSDDTAAFQLFLAALSTYKARGFVPAMTRPYWIKWIDQAYAKSMTVDLHNEAIIKGTKSFQDFSCDGSTASFAITDFDWYDHANGLNADLIDDSTGLVVQQYLKGTHYALIGNILDFTAGSAPAGAPAAGHMLKVSGVVPILYLRKGTGADRIDWTGGHIDCSERGYSQALPSGSGLTLRDWTRGSVFNADFLGAQSYIDARERRISDTGLGLNSVKNFLVEGNYFRGWGDLGVYATGGASGGDPSNDGGSLTVNGNTFDGCNCGIKAVREMQGVIITGNKFTECATGVLNGLTGVPALESGTDYIVSDNIFRKTGRRAVDLRAMARGANVSGNRIIDIGCLPNGSPYTLDDGTLDPSPAAIVLSGCSQSKVQGNWLGFEDWAGDNNQRAIQISSNVYASGLPAYGRGIDVSGNYIAGFVDGITETGNPANLGPNIYTANRMLSVTTPMTVTSGANWDYLDLSTGIRKFGRGAASWNEGANAWTPSLAFSGPSGTPTITYGAIRRGSYTRDPATGKLTIQFQVQATITHTETVAPLRLTGLPFMVPNADDKGEGIGVIRRLSGAIALPAGTVQVVMRALPERTDADVYFITNSSGSFSEIVLSGSLVSSGTTVVLYGVLEYLID